MKTKPRLPKVRIARPDGRPFQLRYADPATGREVRISTKTRDEDDALEQKKNLEAKLRLGLEARPKRKAAKQGPGMSWDEFREEYTRLKVATFRSELAKNQAEINIDICSKVLSPRTLGEMADPSALARLQSELLIGACSPRIDPITKKPLPRSAHTVRSYLATLIAALNWAHRPMHWLPESVDFRLMDADDPDKGRPITGEEFDRMIEAVPKIVGDARAPAWTYLLRGLWESGLRLSEALGLSWDDAAMIMPHWPRHGLPYLRIPAKQQKSRKAQDVPTTPAFAALLEETPEALRTGCVFKGLARRGVKQLTRTVAGRPITAIGKRALVCVNAAGKWASAHDLRRSFGQRMADTGMHVRDLQAMMRHASLSTTEAYYLRDRIQDQAARIAKYLGTPAAKKEQSPTSEVGVSLELQTSAGKRS